MADRNDPPNPPRKHKVIHWNPDSEEGQATKKPALKVYLVGILFALSTIAVLAGGYFLFFYESPSEFAPASAAEVLSDDPRIAFESVSYAQGVKENTRRKLEAARQMPTGGHDVLRQMLINIEKEYINADELMRRTRYARAINQFNYVDELIEDFAQVVDNKQQAQNLYDDFLVRSSDLEDAKHLNEDAFEDAFIAASAGNQFLQSGSFTPALQRLQEATEKLDAVENTIEEYINTNAGLGHRAIAQGKKEEAIAAFTSILELEPDNEDALKQLRRARTADQVYANLQEGKQQEEAGNLEAALEAYQKAFDIDSSSAKAQAGISRTQSKIEERDFNFHYSHALEANQDGRFEEAIEHFQAALQIFPKRTDIEDAIDTAREEKRQSDIVTRVTLAYDYERKYQWEKARNLYQELVNIEPDLQEAKDGLLRTGRMIRSILRYETLLEAAKKEAKRADFQAAVRTFDRAMQSKPTYIELDEDSERLRRFLQLQTQPVPIQFISDESTWVSIQGPTPSKPEKFENQTISLLPGKYFVIGRKKNYQDVRFNLQVRAGVDHPPVTVICDTRNPY